MGQTALRGVWGAQHRTARTSSVRCGHGGGAVHRSDLPRGQAWRAISFAGCAALLGDVEGFAIGTYDAIAVLTGARRGMPRPLANELARIFASTWGC